jgi:hypothetical protein
MQAVLEREPHAKIGREAQSADDLSGAQRLGCAPSTVRTHAADTIPVWTDRRRSWPRAGWRGWPDHGGGLRIASAEPEPDGPGALRLSAALGPGENDRVIEASGARVT